MPNICLYIDKKRISPYAMSVYVALTEKGLHFQEKVIDLDQQEQHSLAYRRICPTGKIPCLVVNDFHLFESWAITEYVENNFPFPEYPALYPDETKARAKCRAVQALVKTDFISIRQAMPSDSIFVPPQVPAIFSAEAMQDIQRLLAVTDTVLGEELWLTEHWSIADFDLAFMLHRLLSHQIELPEKIQAYIQRNFQRSSVQSWIQENAKLGA
ncbi:glutathione transferase [Acinetobacter bohemicus]|uniref:glutathione transferase n=1 Tax=Acinetobacter TaxID=469 RepID=UPI00157D737E|nr:MULTISPECIES: glutathione transferase [Acinetobacter]MCO8042288.1 glutathione transferase [Acinetobacter sp. S4400-12]MCU7224538.1 glutathione transferase [Acinetobacter bohemicus]MDM1780433.1 glutathione transferase [Acinetobacter indicus]QKQ69960.1 glutathione transferase [Acinetobacter sp. 10FS3-1]